MVDLHVTERLRRTALMIWATIGGLALTAVLLFLASQVRIIWLPLVFAAGLVVILDPVVRALERISIPRVLGVIFGFLVLGTVLVAVGFLVVPAVRTQASDFGVALPGLYDAAVQFLRETGERIGIDLGPVWTSQTIQEWISNPDNQSSLQELIGGFGSGAGRLLRGITETVAVVFLAPILAFYLLMDLPRSKTMVLELTPPRYRDEFAYVTHQLGTALSSFVRGQLLVALVVGTLSAVTLWLFDLPFWLIIGIATGLLNLIPFVGPFVGATLAAGVALLEGHLGVAVAIVVAFTLIQQIDNHIITPMIQRARVRLSPLIIVLALLAGGSIAGLLGVVVAVPTVTVIRIVAGHVWRTRVLGESWAEATEAMIEKTEPTDRLRVPNRRRQAAQAKLFDTMELEPSGQEGEPVTVPPERSDGP